GRAARRRQIAARGDLSGLAAALPADHDDDVRGAVRGIALDARHRHGFGIAPPARGDDRRRPHSEPGADPVHDAGHLPRLRPARLTVSLSTPFIERPVATTLLTIGLALAGIFAFFKLPVSPLPQVDFPTISVFAQMPGASPETMATTVATPLERHLGVIADVTEMTSSSTVGSTR